MRILEVGMEKDKREFHFDWNGGYRKLTRREKEDFDLYRKLTTKTDREFRRATSEDRLKRILEISRGLLTISKTSIY